jgi:hypothetical protein
MPAGTRQIRELRFACLQMESYQQQLKEQQAKLHKASKQAQEAASKATAQQQVSFKHIVFCMHHYDVLACIRIIRKWTTPVASPALQHHGYHGSADIVLQSDDSCSGCLLCDLTEPAAACEVGTS